MQVEFDRLKKEILRGNVSAADRIVFEYSSSTHYSSSEKLKWYTLAAQHGSAFGAWHAGNWQYGHGDCSKALEWFRRAHELRAKAHEDTRTEDDMVEEVSNDPKCHPIR